MKTANKKEKFNQSIIRYASCWEDADVLLSRFDATIHKNILSIASAGDNSFAFLAFKNTQVVAVDINPEQLHLCRLKQLAIMHFDYLTYLDFLGMSGKKRFDYAKTKALIPENDTELKAFLERNQSDFEKFGIAKSGKFEKYFRSFRKYILPLVHRNKTIEQLFETKSEEEQILFYEKQWNNRMWRLLLKVFFSKFILGKFGRHPDMLKEVDINVGDFIKSHAHDHLRSTLCQKNYFLQMILLGKYHNDLPFYLREENFEKIKKNIHNIQFKESYPQNATLINDEKFDFVNFSNIFEYMDAQIFSKTVTEINENLNINAIAAYWNLMVPREFSTINQSFSKVEFSNQLNDKGFFYRDFHLSKKVK